MPRRARVTAAGVAHHVVQRGNNHQPVFFAAQDYQAYLDLLSEGRRRYGCAIHAYVLMPNHVHLLMTPATKDALASLMRYAGSRYVRHFNDVYRRRGALWEDRFKSNLVATGDYLLACHHHVELNPVRAGIVERPEHYRWSSYAWHALGKDGDLITDHEAYLTLGATSIARRAAYVALHSREPNPELPYVIRRALNRGLTLGAGQSKEAAGMQRAGLAESRIGRI